MSNQKKFCVVFRKSDIELIAKLNKKVEPLSLGFIDKFTAAADRDDKILFLCNHALMKGIHVDTIIYDLTFGFINNL
jgi:hypothetical protein